MKLVNKEGGQSTKELREYRRVKVAACRARKIRVIKDLQDDINAYRAKLGLPPKDFKKSSGSRKGKPRPNYEPPFEKRQYMTRAEISAWKIAERKKRRNEKARAEKEKEDEMVRDLQKEWKELRRQVGELSGDMMEIESESTDINLPVAKKLNCEKAGKKMELMDEEKLMAARCKPDRAESTGSDGMQDNEFKAAAAKSNGEHTRSTVGAPMKPAEPLKSTSEYPIPVVPNKNSITTEETNKEVNMKGSCTSKQMPHVNERTSSIFESAPVCSTETDLKCLMNDDGHTIDLMNLYGSRQTKVGPPASGVADNVADSFPGTPMPSYSDENWNNPIDVKLDFEGIENIIEPSKNESSFECDDLSAISCMKYNPTDDLSSLKKLAVGKPNSTSNSSAICHATINQAQVNDKSVTTKVNMETDENAFILSSDPNALIPDPAYADWCNDVVDLLDSEVNDDVMKEEFVFGKGFDHIVTSQADDPLFQRPLTGIDVDIQALSSTYKV